MRSKLTKQKVGGIILITLFGLGALGYFAWWLEPKILKPEVISLSGSSSYEIGVQYGQKAKDKIQGAATFVASFEPILKLLGINFSQKIEEYMAYIPQYLKDEMDGVAEGAGVEKKWIYGVNIFPEVFIGIAEKPMECSQFIKVGGIDGDLGPIFGRTLDFPPDAFIQNFQVVLVIDYPGQVKLIGHTIAGMVGFLTGMNDLGLSASISMVSTHETGPGLPVVIGIRNVLQNNTTVSAAAYYLGNATHGLGWNYALVDKTGNAAVVEVTHKYNNTRWINMGGEAANYICATNVFHSPTMASHGAVSENSWVRKRTLESTLNSTDSFSLLGAIQLLRNSTNPQWNVWDPSGDTINRDWKRKNLIPMGSLFAMINVPMHNFTLVASGLPARQPFYAVNFAAEVVGPVA